MAAFYTNVALEKNTILEVGYENGKRFRRKVPYKPYLFVNTKRDSKYRTIHGQPVGRLDFDSVYEARTFVKEHANVPGMSLYGLTDYTYTYIFDNYKGQIPYDVNVMSIVGLDIEVDIINKTEFPDPVKADNEVNLITLSRNGKTTTLGCKPYKCQNDTETFILCKDEKHLLEVFLGLWQSKEFDPDIVTGWNCIPADQSVWLKDRITSIDSLKQGDVCFGAGRAVVRKSPTSIKQKWDVYTSIVSGPPAFAASADHKLVVRSIPKGSYTCLRKGPKQKFLEQTLTVEQVAGDTQHDHYIKYTPRDNPNEDNTLYNDDLLYLCGLIYTDGSLKTPRKLEGGYVVYQSDKEFLENLPVFTTSIVGPHKDNYSRGLESSLVDVHHRRLIYNDDGHKRINKEALSTLSRRQWMLFLSGLLDGDGAKSHGKFELRNFNDDLESLQELALWNGLFVTRQKNTIRFANLSPQELSLRKHSRWGNFSWWKPFVPTYSSSNRIKYRYVDGDYWVKITGVVKTDEMVEMLDIETTDHLFVTCGYEVHNCEGFDIPYLINRITKVLGEAAAKRLSPWGILRERVVEVMGNEVTMWTIVGVSVLDYMQIYKKFSFTPQERHTLDHIASMELGERKVDYGQYGSLAGLQEHNWQLFTEYNIKDVKLVDAIEAKRKLLMLVIDMAYDAKINFIDTFTTVKSWDIIIHNHLLERCVVIPFPDPNREDRSILGGYVKEPQEGGHEWVVSFDLNSLYPHLIMQYNISPETFAGWIEGYDSCESKHIAEDRVHRALSGYLKDPKLQKYLHDNDVSVTGNGATFYRNREGFLPTLMRKYYNERAEIKAKMKVSENKLELVEREMMRRGLIAK